MTDRAAADLAGITLIDLGGIGPAARCVRALADLGARWIRVVAPPGAGRIDPPWHVYGALRGAEDLPLDLKTAAGRDVLLRLARRADVVVECFRPGVADRLGIGYAALQAVNPRLVYCAATGFGQTGPYAQLAAHDLNYQALSGVLAASQRRADGAPPVPPLTVADSAGGGWQAALRIAAALYARERTGAGQYLDVSASEGMLHLNALAIDDHLAGGATAEFGGLLTGGYACYDVYPTRDGKHLAVAAIEKKFFATLCEALGQPGLAKKQYDPAAQEELRATLADCFRQRERGAWVDALSGLDVCVTPVLSSEEAIADPHWQATGAFVAYDHPEHGRTRQVAALGRGERGPPPRRDRAALMGVMRLAGLQDDAVARLEREGAFGGELPR